MKGKYFRSEIKNSGTSTKYKIYHQCTRCSCKHVSTIVNISKVGHLRIHFFSNFLVVNIYTHSNICFLFLVCSSILLLINLITIL